MSHCYQSISSFLFLVSNQANKLRKKTKNFATYREPLSTQFNVLVQTAFVICYCIITSKFVSLFSFIVL